jgi:hypothetical protein
MKIICKNCGSTLGVKDDEKEYFQGGMICGFFIGLIGLTLVVFVVSLLPVPKSYTPQELQNIQKIVCRG